MLVCTLSPSLAFTYTNTRSHQFEARHLESFKIPSAPILSDADIMASSRHTPNEYRLLAFFGGESPRTDSTPWERQYLLNVYRVCTALRMDMCTICHALRLTSRLLDGVVPERMTPFDVVSKCVAAIQAASVLFEASAARCSRWREAVSSLRLNASNWTCPYPSENMAKHLFAAMFDDLNGDVYAHCSYAAASLCKPGSDLTACRRGIPCLVADLLAGNRHTNTQEYVVALREECAEHSGASVLRRISESCDAAMVGQCKRGKRQLRNACAELRNATGCAEL